MHALISRKYAGENYDICSDIDCQVYGRLNKRSALTDSAIKATEGLCLTFNDEIIPAYFSSNFGGMSESVEKIWEHRAPAVDYYLSKFDSDIKLDFSPFENPARWIYSSPDVFCNPEFQTKLPQWSKKNFRWKTEIKKEDIVKSLNNLKANGNLKKIEVVERAT